MIKISDCIQAGFVILVMLMRVDGEISNFEKDLVIEFLKDNWSNVDFDSKTLLNDLLHKSISDVLAAFGSSAAFLLNNASAEERDTVMSYALDLILADGRVSSEELKMSSILAGIWGMDINALMLDKMK